MNQLRVIVSKKPPLHGTGEDSPPCTCRGRTGTIVWWEGPGGLCFVKFDSGGKAGMPVNCVRPL